MADADKIREAIRKELLQVRGFKPFSDGYNYNKYYVLNLEDNLIGGNMTNRHREMFEKGSGGELHDTPAKAKAIDSSSMLTYNFFRHICEDCPVEIDGIKYNKVFFEVQIKTLKKGSPANMDVVLMSEDKNKVLFIESKFLEYLYNDSVKFSDSYGKKESYFEDNDEENDNLIEMYNKFKNMTERYNDGIKQNICHLIGISNLKRSGKAQTWFKNNYKDSSEILQILDAKEYRFMNIIFRPSNKDALGYCNNYIEDLLKFRNSLPTAIETYTKGKFIMDYREFYEKLSSSNLNVFIKEELKKRYIDFHTK